MKVKLIEKTYKLTQKSTRFWTSLYGPLMFSVFPWALGSLFQELCSKSKEHGKFDKFWESKI